MTIIDELLTVGNGGTHRFDPIDPQWYRFFQDHREEVLQNADIKMISREDLYPHRWDIQSYLDSINVDIALTWMVKDLNSITDITFTQDTCSQLTIPNLEHISELYNRYIAVTS